jgi:L-cysteine desulfidase
MLAIQNKFVTNVEGLIEDDVDRCIRNLTLVGAKGMQETDRMVLDIMTHKKC